MCGENNIRKVVIKSADYEGQKENGHGSGAVFMDRAFYRLLWCRAGGESDNDRVCV